MVEVYDLEGLLARPALREEMHELRYRQFYEKRRWDIPAVKGVEIDQYDRREINPVYFLARDASGRLCGSCRLIPTTGPYMIRDLFAHMLGDRPLPESPRIWEATRIAADTASGARAAMRTTGALLAAVCEFGMPRGIRFTIGTYEAAVIRLFRVRGVPATWVGAEHELADCRCALALHPVNDRVYRRILDVNRLSAPVISLDATLYKEEAA
ncbi:MAG: hypothetical protein D6807_03060 [Alphaproteobacteria bacterium]|nr:MAG: hypothetical protein D6807_03060 [Alphaproteobacteria bacterium]